MTFWTSHTAGTDISAFQQIDDFNAQGGAQVELVQVRAAETDATQLITAVRGGTGPTSTCGPVRGSRASDGLLEDLTQFSDDPLAGYIESPPSRPASTTPPALPFDTDTRALYYNIGMLEEAGIDPAPLDPANGAITWDALKEMANQLNVEEGDTYSRLGIALADMGKRPGLALHLRLLLRRRLLRRGGMPGHSHRSGQRGGLPVRLRLGRRARAGRGAGLLGCRPGSQPARGTRAPFTEQVGFIISGRLADRQRRRLRPRPELWDHLHSGAGGGCRVHDLGWRLVAGDPRGCPEPEGGTSSCRTWPARRDSGLHTIESAHLPTLRRFRPKRGCSTSGTSSLPTFCPMRRAGRRSRSGRSIGTS